MAGVILLVFIALLVAYLWNRFRGRAGLKVSGSTWLGAVIVVIMLVLMLWASSQR